MKKLERSGPGSTNVVRQALVQAFVSFVALLGVATISGVTLYEAAYREQVQSIREELKNLARVAASLVDVDQHQRLVSADQTDSALHLEALAPVVKFHESLPHLQFVYSGVLRSGKIHFVLDTQGRARNTPTSSMEKPPLFDVYEEQDPVMLEALQTGEVLANPEPWKDELGTFLSGFAPLKDRTGKLVGVVGVDISLRDFQSRMDDLAKALRVAGLIALFVSTLIAVLIYLLRFESLKQQEDRVEMEKENRVLAELARRTHNMVILTDPLGRVEWVNEAFEIQTGYSLREVSGKTPGSVLQGPLTDQKTVEVMREGLRQGVGFHVEALNYRKDGKSYWVDIEVRPLKSASGDVLKFLAIEADITARKEYEAKMSRAMAAAEAGSRAKSHFLAVMSHEIRTPMNSILGFADLLSTTSLSDEQKEYLTNIRTSGTSLLNLITDLLDFSKIESSRFKMEIQNVDLRQLMEQVVTSFGPYLKDKPMALKWEIGEGVPSLVTADGFRLKQILNNLIGNAIKFTERGEVNVQLRRLPDRSVLRFEVRDTGPGIPKNQFAELFQIFSQGDNSPSRRHEGSGLGLAISKKLVEKMNGQIGVESDVGVGSCFYFEIPLVEPRDGQAFEAPKPRPLGSGGHEFGNPRVLLVEDNELNRRVAELMLFKLGITVVHAENAREALAQLENNSFDLVLMDVQMPGMDGKQLTSLIRQEGRFAGLDIVAMTASATLEEREACLNSGMDDFVSKPITLESLRALLQRSWLRRKERQVIAGAPSSSF